MWFDGQAEEAAQHYVAAFKNSKIDHVTRQGAKAFVVNFTLDGLQYVALNGGPMFKPTEAFSLAVTCEDQSEVDRLWEHLLQGGGEPSRCGWLKDRWGYSWSSPRATWASDCFNLRASPANTSGGNVASRRSTSASSAAFL